MKWNIGEVKSKLITVGLTQQIIVLDFMESVISQKNYWNHSSRKFS